MPQPPPRPILDRLDLIRHMLSLYSSHKPRPSETSWTPRSVPLLLISPPAVTAVSAFRSLNCLEVCYPVIVSRRHRSYLAEFRNKIYDYALANEEAGRDVFLYRRFGNRQALSFNDTHAGRAHFGLTQVCQIVRPEFSTMYLTSFKSVVSMEYLSAYLIVFPLLASARMVGASYKLAGLCRHVPEQSASDPDALSAIYWSFPERHLPSLSYPRLHSTMRSRWYKHS